MLASQTSPNGGAASAFGPTTAPDRRSRARRWVLADGLAATLRQVRADDAAALDAMLRRQSRASRYFRFHSAVNGLTEKQLARLTRTDDPLQLGLVLTLDGPGVAPLLVAEARFASDDGVSGEVATIVDEAWRRRGLCSLALEGLLAGARRVGLRYLHGRVLDSNDSMLGLARRARWSMTRDPEDGRVRCFRIELGRAGG